MYIEETQEHIYNCAEHKDNFQNIYKDTHETKTMKEVINRFLSIMKKKDQLKEINLSNMKPKKQTS